MLSANELESALHIGGPLTDLTEYKKKFDQALSSENLEYLEIFADKKEWTHLDKEERERLADFLLNQGERLAKKNDPHALEIFKRVRRVFPKNLSQLYRQALALAATPPSSPLLRESIELFEKILKLKPHFFGARIGFATALLSIAKNDALSDAAHLALEQFLETENSLKETSIEEQTQFWRGYGLCLYLVGMFSGEPHDFKKATDCFIRAKELGADDEAFWIDYGNATFELSKFTENREVLIEATEMFQKAVKQNPRNELCWHHLARALTNLFEIAPHDSCSSSANACFEKLIELNPNKAVYWFHWGELLLLKSKEENSIESLLQGRSKFEMADHYEPDHPHILGALAESYMLLGVRTEDPSPLKYALTKIEQGLQQDASFAPLLRLKADCLFELGGTYKDAHFLKLAAAQYRDALRIEPRNKFLWHGLAVALSILGHQQNDSSLLSESLQIFPKVMELGGEEMPQFWNDWGTALVKKGLLCDDLCSNDINSCDFNLDKALGFDLQKQRSYFNMDAVSEFESRELSLKPKTDFSGRSSIHYFQMAVPKFEKAVTLGAKQASARHPVADWLYHLGCAYEFIGDIEWAESPYEKALEAFSKALEIDPSFQVVYFNLACVLARMGELTSEVEFFNEANQLFEKVTQFDFEDDQAWCEWGISLLNMAELISDPSREESANKCYAEAEKMLSRAIALGNLNAYYYLACVYSLTRYNEAAIHQLEKCREHRVLPRLEELLADHWLDNVRETTLFRHFLAQF